MCVAMLWYGQVNLVSLQKFTVVPLYCWSVLDYFMKRVKRWECHWMSLRVACSRGIKLLCLIVPCVHWPAIVRGMPSRMLLTASYCQTSVVVSFLEPPPWLGLGTRLASVGADRIWVAEDGVSDGFALVRKVLAQPGHAMLLITSLYRAVHLVTCTNSRLVACSRWTCLAETNEALDPCVVWLSCEPGKGEEKQVLQVSS